MELPDSESVCAFACVSVCLLLDLEQLRAGIGGVLRGGVGGGGLPALVCTFPTSPTLVPFWGMNG